MYQGVFQWFTTCCVLRLRAPRSSSCLSGERGAESSTTRAKLFDGKRATERLATHAAKTREPSLEGQRGADPFLFAFDVVYCLSEVNTWGAVHDEMHMKQDDSILESGCTDNDIRKVIPNQSSRSGSRGVPNLCFSTSSILHQPSCWARELCFDIGCGEDTLLFRLAWLHSRAVHRDGHLHNSIAVHRFSEKEASLNSEVDRAYTPGECDNVL